MPQIITAQSGYYECDGSGYMTTLNQCASSCSAVNYPSSPVCEGEVASSVTMNWCGTELDPYALVEVFRVPNSIPVKSGFATPNDPFEITFNTTGYYYYKVTCKAGMGTSDPKDDTTYGCYLTDTFLVNVTEKIPTAFTIDNGLSASTDYIPVTYADCDHTFRAEWNGIGNPVYQSACNAQGTTCKHRWRIYNETQSQEEYNSGWLNGLPDQTKSFDMTSFDPSPGDTIQLELSIGRDGCTQSSFVQFYYLGGDGASISYDFIVSPEFRDTVGGLSSLRVPGAIDCGDAQGVGGSKTYTTYDSLFARSRLDISDFYIAVKKFDSQENCVNNNGVYVTEYGSSFSGVAPDQVDSAVFQSYFHYNNAPSTNYWPFAFITNEIDGSEYYRHELTLTLDCPSAPRGSGGSIDVGGEAHFRVLEPYQSTMLGESENSPDKVSSSQGITAYPGEINKALKLRIQNYEEPGEIQIYNTNGILEYQSHFERQGTIVSNPYLRAGMYFYLIRSSQGRIMEKGKIVVVQ